MRISDWSSDVCSSDLLRLAPQKEPYWMMLNEGEHLGYYRGFRVAKWVARFRLPQKGAPYQRITLGEADDYADADGQIILDFKQAQDAARRWFLELHRNRDRKAGVYTVSDALDEDRKSTRLNSSH